MNNNKSSRWFLITSFVILQLALIAVSFLIGLFSQEWFGLGRQFPILSEAHRILQENSIIELPLANKLEYGMVKGMVEAVGDPYTSFVEPPEHKLQTAQLDGKFGGIGARLEKNNQNQFILYPFPDSPAEVAGIMKGDILYRIESNEISLDATIDQIEAALRGKVGTSVNITIGRDGRRTDFQITRVEYAIPSVTWNLFPENQMVGIIHATLVAETTPDEISRAIEELQKQGATHFILDLRNNSGGLVNAGVNIAKLFLKDGQVISEQFRNRPEKTFTAETPGKFVDLPLIIVVNHNTASAAEIVAGSLQGAHRAKLAGSRTYGKTAIQLVFTLSDQSSLHVTAGKWQIPGVNLNPTGIGLEPDILMNEDQASSSEAVTAAVRVLLP
jgi:carboxyl-terminal processing protease